MEELQNPETGTSTETTSTPLKKIVRVGNVPQSDLDFGNVATGASKQWLTIPALSLLWKKPEDFSDEVHQYNSTLNERRTAGSERHPITSQLDALDMEIDKRTENVKDYIADKYDKTNASPYYAKFGIVKTGKIYKLPADRNDRVVALQQVVDGIHTEGFDNNTYGKTYWTDVHARYSELTMSAKTIDSKISGKVATKNQLKKEIKKTLNALIHLLKANYPDSWKSELRIWGFQKEKY